MELNSNIYQTDVLVMIDKNKCSEYNVRHRESVGIK